MITDQLERPGKCESESEWVRKGHWDWAVKKIEIVYAPFFWLFTSSISL